MAKVKALKPFHGTAEEGFVQAGGVVEVTPERHADLARNGLLPPPKSGKGGAAAEPADQSEPGVVKSAARPARSRKIVGE